MRTRFIPRPRWWPGQDRVEPLTGPASRGVRLGALLMAVGALFVLEVVLPALPGGHPRPPFGILVHGAISGSLTGITAVALILVYRTNRIINFSQAALGSVAAVVVAELVTGYDLPFLVVAPIGLLFAIGGGVLAELLLRRFFRAPRLVVTIATIALAPALSLLLGRIVSSLTPPPPGTDAAQQAIKTVPAPFNSVVIRLPDSPLVFHVVDIATIVGAVALTAGLALFLSRTRLGRAVRGSAENAEAAWLLGINIRIVATLVWAIAALLSGFAALATLAQSGYDTSGSAGGVAILLPALVAAMVAGMEMPWMAMFTGIWIGAVESGVQWAFPDLRFIEVGLLALMLVSLFLQRRRLQRRESASGNAWEAVRGIRPTPPEMERVPLVRNTRYALIGSLLAATVLYPLLSSAGGIVSGGLVLIGVMVTVSLLILTGWSGQVSLGQFAIVAIGAVVAGSLIQRVGVTFWIAAPVAGLVGAGTAVGLGLPALRLRGLYLAAVTLALALVVPTLLFDQNGFGWLLPTASIPRPHLLFIDMADDKAYYYLLLAITVAVVSFAMRFRRTRAGRVLIALRDNEAAAQSAGLSVLGARITAFAISGMIAGLAGALLAVLDQVLSVASFGPQASINVFLFLIIGGVGSVSGAVIGAVVGGGLPFIVPTLASLLTGLGAFFILMLRPDGLAGVLFSMRDAILRIIALRLHIVVPSLFADYDAEAQRRRQLPIAAPVSGRGLDALPSMRRYRRASWVYRRREV